MSNTHQARELPERPDLAQLRKQAKELKAKTPHETLAAAQFALAQEYGFESWPKLVLAAEQKLFALAIKNGDNDLFDRLVSSQPRLAKLPFQDGQFPLHLAVWHNDLAMIRKLVVAGAPLEGRVDGNGHTALSWAVTGWARESAIQLVELGCKVDLFCAAGLGLSDLVQQMVDSGREDLSWVGSSRVDAVGHRVPGPPSARLDQISDGLYMACRNGHTETARILLQAGADVNWRAFIGATPLHWAMLAGVPELINLLVDNGADRNLRDTEFQALPNEFPGFVLVGWGFPDERILAFIQAHPASAKYQTPTGTLLHWAVIQNRSSVAMALIAHGADRDAKDASGLTAGDLAKSLGRDWTP